MAQKFFFEMCLSIISEFFWVCVKNNPVLLTPLKGNSDWIWPSGHTTLKWRRINVDATWSRRSDVDTTSFWCCVPAGEMHRLTEKTLIRQHTCKDWCGHLLFACDMGVLSSLGCIYVNSKDLFTLWRHSTHFPLYYICKNLTRLCEWFYCSHEVKMSDFLQWV